MKLNSFHHAILAIAVCAAVPAIATVTVDTEEFDF
jgi:hypothetical protein